METPSQRRLTIADLPHRIENFPLAQKLESRQKVGNFFTIAGVVVAFIGVLIMIGGPSSILVSYSGPTLTQFILLNPGMVVSIGVFLLCIGSQIAPPVVREIEAFISENFTLVDDHGIPSVERVIAGQIEPGGHLNLVLASAPPTPESQT